MAFFLVTGATGRQGGSTARRLLEKGARVRAFVRNPNSDAAKAIQSEGAELFQGELTDSALVGKALEGIRGVFYNPPYPGPDSAKTDETFISACAAHKDTLFTFVLSSASGVEKHAEKLEQDPNYPMVGYWAMKSDLEKKARGAAFRHLLILRPSFLMHGYLLPDAETVFPDLAQQRLVTALRPETRVPHLQAEDVGVFASAALLEPKRFSGIEINLAAENLTASEVVEKMSSVAGNEVHAPVAQFEDGKAVGVTSPIAAYHEWANEVDASVNVEALRKRYGLPRISLQDFFVNYKEMSKETIGI